MSWHTSGIGLKVKEQLTDHQLFELLGIKSGKAKGTISFDEAGTSMIEGRAIGVSGDWMMIFDPMMFITPTSELEDFGNTMWDRHFEKRLIQASKKADIFGFILEGTSGTAGFSFYSQGTCKRVLLVQEDQIVVEVGSPIQEEKAVFEEETDSEQRVLLLAERIGFDFSSDRQMETPFRLHDYPTEVPYQ